MAGDSEPVLRHHWRAFFSGGFLSLTRLATGFIRAKYVALALGTAGVGFLSQATQLQLLGVSIGSLAITVGIINRMGTVGPARSDREGRLLSTAFTVQITVSLALPLLAIIFSGPLIDFVFGANAFQHSALSSRDVLVVVSSVPLWVVASGFLEPVYLSAGRYDLLVRASIWATVCGFAATIVMIAMWGLRGAFWSVFASALLLLTSFLLHLRRVRPVRELFHFGFDWSEASKLLRFSFALLLSGALVPAARLWLQRKVIESLGIEANGLLQVPFAVTAYYTPFLTNALWGRLHPAVTRLGPSAEARRELTAALRLTVAMSTAAIVTILLLKDILVPLAYSRAFLPATRLLPAQLLGDYFYFIALVFAVYALGISRLFIYFVSWVAYSVVAVSASVALIPTLGLLAVPVGYGLSGAIGAVVSLGWFVSRGDEGLLTTMAMVLAGLVVVATQCYLAWRGGHVVIQACLCLVTSLAAAAFLWTARSASPRDPSEGVPIIP